jgi:hypothetical protein
MVFYRSEKHLRERGIFPGALPEKRPTRSNQCQTRFHVQRKSYKRGRHNPDRHQKRPGPVRRGSGKRLPKNDFHPIVEQSDFQKRAIYYNQR